MRKFTRVQENEAELQAAVIGLATYLGWKHYHTHDSRKSNPGFPDLILVRRSRIVYAELKSQAGKTSPEQDAWLEALAQAGAEVWLWRPSDWPEIQDVLTRETAPNRSILNDNG